MISRRLSFVLGSALLGVVAIGSVNVAAAPGHVGQLGRVPPLGVLVDDPAYGDLLAFMLAIGSTDAQVEQLAGEAQEPTNPEFINPFGLPGPVAQPDYLTPLLTATVELSVPNMTALAAPGGPLAQGAGPLGSVSYGQGLTSPTGTQWYMYAKAFAAAPCPATGTREYGIVATDTTPLDGGNPEPFTTGSTTNLFYGANTAYVIHTEPGVPFEARRYQRAAAGTQPDFGLTDSDWMAICTGDTVIGLIPADEWDGIESLRFFGFDVPIVDGQEQSNDASQMRVPGIDEDPQPIDENLEEIQLGEEAPSEAPTESPTAAPTQAPTLPPESTPQTTAPARTQPPEPTANHGPTPAPGGSTTGGGGGIDPLILTFLIGLGLVGLALIAFLLSSRPDDCDELGKLAKAAKDECDKARRVAEEARTKHARAAEELEAVQAYEHAARANVASAEEALAKAEARASQKSSSYVEGEPYGRMTGDDLAIQNEANARVQADADTAKADARQAWKDAGGQQGDAAAKLDDDLSAIGKAAAEKMAHNNDPANLPELRKTAAEKAKAELASLRSELDAARKSLEEATASLGNASETESGARAAADAAQAEADRICNEAAAAQKAYDDCVGAKSAAAAAVKPTTVKPTTVKPTTVGVDAGKTGGGGTVGGGTTTGGGTTSKGDPPSRACQDGDESWEPIGPARSFTIRDNGAKTRVILWTDPGIKGLDQWIKESGSAGGRDSGEHHPSITSPEIDFITPERLTEWLRGLGGSQGLAAPNMNLHFEIKRKLRTVQCERRWVCRNGAWQPGETRAQVTDSPLPPQHLDEGPVTPSIQKVQGFLTRVKAIINKLKAEEEEAEKAARCE